MLTPSIKNIAHGLMSSSFFSGIFGTQLPGEGSIYTYQSLKFKETNIYWRRS